MLFLPWSPWVLWLMELFQDFRTSVTSESIVVWWEMTVFKRRWKWRSNCSCEVVFLWCKWLITFSWCLKNIRVLTVLLTEADWEEMGGVKDRLWNMPLNWWFEDWVLQPNVCPTSCLKDTWRLLNHLFDYSLFINQRIITLIFHLFYTD